MERVTDVIPVSAYSGFTRLERAAAGFLSEYTGTTRTSHAAELRMWAQWCFNHHLDVLDDVRREHINAYALELEEVHHRKRTTIAHKISALRMFYKWAFEEEVISRNPAANVKRPKFEYYTTRAYLDRMELIRFIDHAKQGSPRDTALCLLLALNGLRIAEALGTDVSDLGRERGHRTLHIIGKGHKDAVIPLAPPVALAIDVYLNGRTSGPIFLGACGERMNRHAAARIVARVTRKAGVDKHISPHCLRHSFITAGLDAGISLRDMQHAARHSDTRTTSWYDHGRSSMDGHATYIVTAVIAGA